MRERLVSTITMIRTCADQISNHISIFYARNMAVDVINRTIKFNSSTTQVGIRASFAKLMVEILTLVNIETFALLLI
jgi:hypothetical protein